MFGAKHKRKKGIFFTLDALFGAFLIVTAIVLFSQNYIIEDNTPDLTYLSYDLMNAFSSIKACDLNNSYLIELIENNTVNNTNNTLLETIGELHVLGKSVEAQKLSQNISSQLIPSRYGFSITVDNEEVYTNGKPVTKSLITSKRLISGIEKYKPIKGSASKVYLKGIKNKKTYTYIYFGGFVGQGNISVFTDEIQNDAQFTSMTVKAAFGGNFSFYVNDNYCANFNSSANELEPFEYDVSSCIGDLLNGTRNNFSYYANGSLLDAYIAGGYIKIGYKTSQMTYSQDYYNLTYYLPQVNGVINIYDSVYTPGTINTMEAYLHYVSNQYTYLNIGGVRVYQKNANGTPEFENLLDSYLDYWLPYEDFSNNTIPIRMASYNLTEVLSNVTDIDVVLLTDFSGSMKKNFNTTKVGSNAYACPDVFDPAYPQYDKVRRYNHAKCLDEQFLDIIFNASGARVWPLNLHADTINIYGDDPTLDGNIRSFIVGVTNGLGKTCLPCALNAALDIFRNNNESNRSRYILFMTDGVPTHIPSDGINGTSWTYGTQICQGYCDVNGDCNGGVFEGCTDNLCDAAINSTKYAMQRIINEFNVTVYSVGFGNMETNCPNAVNLLQELANMSINGTFNVSNNRDELLDIYQSIALNILLQANQISQLVNITANFTPGILYGDSYIRFNITPASTQNVFGEIEVLLEEPVSGCSDTVSIPADVRFIEGYLTSYSGIHWTHQIYTNYNESFDLDDFFIDRYWELGDPFRIYIPYGQVNATSNLFNYTLADGPDNFTSVCSQNNSFIYTGAINSQVSYSNVLKYTVGCNWTVEYEDSTTEHFCVPSSYSGLKKCNYTSSTFMLEQYDHNDTYDDAAYRLFDSLDFDDDGQIFVNLGELDLRVDAISVNSVPYPWGPAIAEVRIWQ